jgi:hypothetical protein
LVYGEVGNDTPITIKIEGNEFIVENLQIQIADDNINIVSWNASGEIENIDYYLLTIVDQNDLVIERISLHQFGDAGVQTYRHDISKLKNTPIRYILTAVSTLQIIRETLFQAGPKR